jgi:DNA-binding MarR family transcriptional regulator
VGGASQAVDRIEAAGRCVRRANPTDRRSSFVELTESGRALLVAGLRVFDEELDRLFRAPLSSRDLDRFGATLAAVRSAAVSDGPRS